MSTYSQTIIADPAISFSSKRLYISCQPTDLVKTFSISTCKFNNGRQGIEVSTIIGKKEKLPEIVSGKIIFSDSKEKLVTLNNPFRDSIYYNIDGNISLTTIYWLDNSQIEILRQKIIKSIIFKVDGNPMTLKISNKSQSELNDLISTNF